MGLSHVTNKDRIEFYENFTRHFDGFHPNFRVVACVPLPSSLSDKATNLYHPAFFTKTFESNPLSTSWVITGERAILFLEPADLQGRWPTLCICYFVCVVYAWHYGIFT